MWVRIVLRRHQCLAAIEAADIATLVYRPTKI